MAACAIFDEDEVCMPISNGGFKYGLVVESSEYISSDEDDEEEDRVQKGTVKVAWHPNGNETVVPENKLILADRSLMPGDVVRRLISGTDSQRGFVQNMDVKCHVKILGTEQYIYNVDIRQVKALGEWDTEPDVTLDSWVGHVIEVNEEVTLKFPDGAKCKVPNASSLNFEDTNDKRETHTEFHMANFYPGQELRGEEEDYEDASWIQTSRTRGPKMTGSKQLYNVTVTVEKVETKSLVVRWMCKGFTKAGAGKDKLATPSSTVEGENLKRMRRLDCFEFCHRQIGDKGYYTIKDIDALVPNLSPRRYATPDILGKIIKENGVILGANSNGLVVLRQDSLDSNKSSEISDKGNCDTASCDGSNIHVNGDTDITNGTEFTDKPEGVEDESDNVSDLSDTDHSQVVTSEHKASTKKSSLMRIKKKRRAIQAKKKHKKHQLEHKPGDTVPVEIFYTFSKCDIMWQDGTLETGIPSPELFPIHHLDELEFFPGDFVIESKDGIGTEYGVVTKCDHKERTVMVKWMKPYQGQSGRPEEIEAVELSVFDIKDHPDYKFRPGHTVIRIGGFEENTELEAVGQVYKLDQSGIIYVWWPDGTITENFPQDLYIISEEYNSELGSSDEWTDFDEEEEEDSDSEVSWDTVDEDDADEENHPEDAKKKASKQPWIISDMKMKELDEMLHCLQGAVSGLLNVILNIPRVFLTKSSNVFLDFLTIFKKCKEMEKLMKSSYFDDEEISNLISEIRDELRKEKTRKLVRHVTTLYHSRTTVEVKDTNMDRLNFKEQEGKDKLGQDGARTAKGPDSSQPPLAVGNEVKGGEARDMQRKPRQILEVETLRKVLIDYGTQVFDVPKALTDSDSSNTDPLLRIIFDTSLQLLVAKSGIKSAPEVNKATLMRSLETLQAVKGDPVVEEKICEDINDYVLTTRTTEGVIVEGALNLPCNKIDNGESQDTGAFTEQGEDRPKNKETIAVESESNSEPCLGATGGVDGDICSMLGIQDEYQCLSVDQRDLCIRFCKSLNPRLLLIQQDIKQKWLAHKLGCDENAPNILEILQEKMIESVESGNGPLKLFSEPDEAGKSEVKMVEELEKLTSFRDLETESSKESSIDKEDDTVTMESQICENKENEKGYILCEETPAGHIFKFHTQTPVNPKAFHVAVNKELMLVQSSLPEGIIVKSFEDRMDLFSVLIKGPANTPYEDGLFIFDVQLPANYPLSPPVFHYHSFCSERLNPNLYEDGKVCVSLLGTWSGKGNEVWTSKSNLLQVLVSIQGLILVNEPYFNEAGYEKQRNTQHGQENSRMYNEMAILKMIQSMTKMAVNPPAVFAAEIEAHLQDTALRMIGRVEHWIKLTQREGSVDGSGDPQTVIQEDPDRLASDPDHGDLENIMKDSTAFSKPDFPLLPASKGFCLTVTKYLEIYKNILSEHILRKPIHNS